MVAMERSSKEVVSSLALLPGELEKRRDGIQALHGKRGLLELPRTRIAEDRCHQGDKLARDIRALLRQVAQRPVTVVCRAQPSAVPQLHGRPCNAAGEIVASGH